MSKELYDPYRKMWVKALPEEVIRQKWLHVLTHTLGFKKHLIAVEQQLQDVTSVTMDAPDRRLDIVCYRQGTCLPLLIVECKAVPFSPNVFEQVIGYNAFAFAPFVALAGTKDALFGWQNKNGIYEFQPGLPTYSELLKWTH